MSVKAWKEEVVIPTYEIGKAEKNPIFLEKRVYQGSSGVVYPYPVVESISNEKTDHAYQAVYIENEYIKVMILPELGGRVQMAYDKVKQRHFVHEYVAETPAMESREPVVHRFKRVARSGLDVRGLRELLARQGADCLLQQDDIRLIEKKDYIANPKPSGYRSLHLIVEVPIFLMNEKRPMKVEVQLRTIAMDFWASLDHKLRYKNILDQEKSSC